MNKHISRIRTESLAPSHFVHGEIRSITIDDASLFKEIVRDFLVVEKDDTLPEGTYVYGITCLVDCQNVIHDSWILQHHIACAIDNRCSRRWP